MSVDGAVFGSAFCVCCDRRRARSSTPYDACSGRFYIQPVSGKCRHLFTRYSTGLF